MKKEIEALKKRIAELEAEIALLKARPKQEFHYHYQYEPQPSPWGNPVIYSSPTWAGGTVIAGGGGTPTIYVD